ncbi:MAG: DUF2569 domain-containing protein [Oxalobacter sp.]|nr:DUF2569 domain-containing protein [Oxalobacter sp.]
MMSEKTAGETPAAKGEILQGVGGWLAFLVISMGILSPIYSLYSFFRETTEWHAAAILMLVINLAACGFYVYGAWRLNSRHVWRSVRLAIICLWVGGFLATIFLLLVGLIFGGWAGVASVLSADKDGVRQFIYPTVWTLYLLRSVRVKNTYRRESDKEELAQYLGVKE